MSKKSKIAFIIISFVLFVTCIVITRNASGYVLPFGWKPSVQKFAPPDAYPENYVICDRNLVEKGFPLTYIKPYDDVSDCTDQHNVLAMVLNVLAGLAFSLSIGWTITNIVEKTRN